MQYWLCFYQGFKSFLFKTSPKWGKNAKELSLETLTDVDDNKYIWFLSFQARVDKAKHQGLKWMKSLY